MGYKTYKFQNTSSYNDDVPTIVIADDHPDWDKIYQNWIKGSNPTNDKEWKIGVFAISKLIEESKSND